MATEKRLIDAYSAIKKIDNYCNNSPFTHPGTTWLRGLELATGLLLAEPTVDAVEVVRCKDCKHWQPIHEHIPHMECQIFRGAYEHGYPTNADDFCSYGERKDND